MLEFLHQSVVNNTLVTKVISFVVSAALLVSTAAQSPFKFLTAKKPAKTLSYQAVDQSTGKVLGDYDTTNIPDSIQFNLPTNLLDDLQVTKNLSVGGSAAFTGRIAGTTGTFTGPVTASNLIYGLTAGNGIKVGTGQKPEISLNVDYVKSIDGLTGNISLSAGGGISVSGTTITNSDRGSAQNIFKTFSVSGQDDITAGSNSSALTFVAGTGVSLTTDASNRKLTIDASSASLNSGWADDGTIIRQVTATDKVGIGTSIPYQALDVAHLFVVDTSNSRVGIGITSPTSTLHVVGSATISSNLSAGATTLTSLNNSSGGITNAGPITGATGFTSSGTITLSSLTDGILHANSSGVISSSGVSLALGSADISGTLGTSNGGTGISSYTTGDMLYASATNTVSRLGIGTSGQVLMTVGGVPTWSSITGGSCPTCVIMNPGGTQTITPSSAGATGLIVAQASGGTTNTFGVTNNGSSSYYMIVDSAGRVGIGMTNPGFALEVNGTARINGNFTIGDASSDTVTSTAGSWAFSNATTVDLADSQKTALNFELGLLNLDTSRSRVGIGTTDPLVTLDVNGSINAASGSTYKIAGTDVLSGTTLGSGVISSSLTSVGALASGSIATGFGAISTANNISTTSSGALIIAGNSTLGDASADTLTINAATWTIANATTVDLANSQKNALNFEAGLLNLDTSNSRVGIGTTAPAYTLDVNGTLRVGSTTTLNSLTYTWPSSQGAGYVLQTDGSGALSWIDAASGGSIGPWTLNGSSLYPDLASYNVGIGNSSPGTKLDVTGTGRFSSTLTASSGLTLTTGALSLTSTSGSAALTLDSSKTALNVQSGLFNIDTSNSQVGIGTTAPTSKLQIIGGDLKLGSGSFDNPSGSEDIYVTGNLEVDGNIIGTVTGPITPNGFTQGSVSFAGVGGVLSQNNQKFFWDDTNYRLGVGISSPGQTLQVGTFFAVDTSNSRLGIGTTSPLSTLDFGSASTINLANNQKNSLAFETNLLVLDTSRSNVGIGTTNPTAVLSILGINTDPVLSVVSAPTTGQPDIATFIGGNNKTIKLSWGGDVQLSNSRGYVFTDATQTGLFESVNAGSLIINAQQNVSGIIAFTINNSGASGTGEMMRIATNGNVGIGTTNPSQKLDVGRFFVVDSSNSRLGIGTTSPTSTLHFGSAATVGLATSTTGLNFASGLLDLDSSNTRIGIGTTAPANKLDVNGAMAIGAYAGVGITAPANGLIVSGNVGIGTTAPGALLSVLTADGGTIIVSTPSNTGNGSTGIEFNYAGTTSTGNANIGRIMGHAQSGGGGELLFQTASTSNASYVTQMTVQRGGNVGIGTTSPASKLNIAGGVGIGTTAPGSLYTKTAIAPDGGLIVEGNVGIGTTTPSQTLDIGSFFVVNTSNSRVGIGITSPTSTLHVVGTANITSNATIGGTLGVTGATTLSSTVDITGATSIGGALTVLGAGNSSIAGNLGIGTTNPRQKLDVAGFFVVDSSNSRLGIGTTSPTSTLHFGSAATVGLATSTTGLNFASGLLDLDSSNTRVGIGTTAPSAKLHIVGSSDETQLIARANGTQTSNIFEAQNSSGTALTSITGTGDIDSNITVTANLGSNTHNYIHNYQTTINTDSAAQQGRYWNSHWIHTLSGSNGTSGSSTGNQKLETNVSFTTGATGTTSVYAQDNEFNVTKGTLTLAYGNSAYISAARSTIGQAAAINTALIYDAAGYATTGSDSSITTLKGFNFNGGSASGGATIGTTYGFYNTYDSSSTTVYGFYSTGGTNLFKAGGTSLKPLILQGAAGQTGNLQDWQNSGSTILAQVDSTGNLAVGLSSPSTNTLNVGGFFNVDASNSRVGIGTTAPGSTLTFASAATVGLATSTTGLNFASGLLDLDSSNSRVGIGTTAPTNKLQVANFFAVDSSNSFVGIGTTAPTSTLTFGSASTVGIGVSSPIGLNFASGLLDLDSSNSRVGVGTTAPAATFEVANNSISTGKGFQVSSTSTSFSSGTLANIDWSPTSATTATGDVLAINVGANGVVGNIFNVKNNGTSVFSVSQTAITAGLPVNMQAAGDVAIAYDLNFTNQTASYIKSNAPLYIETGESWESNDLTLRTFNSGALVLDLAGGASFAQAQNWTLASNSVNALNVNSGLLNLDSSFSRVGIGSTAPKSKLTVGGGVGIGTTAASSLYTGTASAPDGGLIVEGSVGIGTTNPSQKLDVAGFFVVDSSNSRLGIGTTSPTSTLHFGSAATVGLATSTTGLNFASGLLDLDSSNTRIGIGTTAPANKLDVNGAMAIGAYAGVGITAPANGLIVSGNVGIGTTAPGYKLEVVGSTRVSSNTNNVYYDFNPAVGRLSINNGTGDSGYGASVTLLNPGGGANMALRSINGYFQIDNNNETLPLMTVGTTGNIGLGGTAAFSAPVLYVGASGKIGIGTTSPTSTLHFGSAATVGLATSTTGLNFGANLLDLDTSNSRIGIGITNPAYKLDVSGTFQATGNVAIGGNNSTLTFNTGTWTLASGFGTTVDLANSTTNSLNFESGLFNIDTSNSRIGIGTTAPTSKLQIVGGNCSDDAGGGGCTADYAELYPSSESVEKGDVLVIDANSTGSHIVKRSSKEYESGMIGIVSSAPAAIADGSNLLFMNNDYVLDPKKPAIALIGRVPVKISSNSQPIKPGDPLTSSSEPGKAMKATKAGVIIGKALESWTPTAGKEKVLAFVVNTWYDPGMKFNANGDIDGAGKNIAIEGFTPAKTQAEFTNLLASFNELKSTQAATADKVSKLEGEAVVSKEAQTQLADRVASLEAQLSNKGVIASGSEAISSSEAVLSAADALLVDKEATLSALTVTGDSHLNNLSVTGTLNVGLLSFDGIGTSISAVASPLKLQSENGSGNLDIFNGKITMTPDGNIKVAKLSVDESDPEAKSIGEGTIAHDKTKVLIKTTAVTSKSRIFVTPKTLLSYPLVVTTKKAGESFTVEVKKPENEDVEFDWWIVN